MSDILLDTQEITTMFAHQRFSKEQLAELARFNKEQLQELGGTILRDSSPEQLRIMQTFNVEILRQARERLSRSPIAESASNLIIRFANDINQQTARVQQQRLQF